jgi:hypothetical protein
MATHGSPLFEAYTRNLRRLYWAEFVDAQNQAARPVNFRASLVEAPLQETENLATAYDYHRHRTIPGEPL